MDRETLPALVSSGADAGAFGADGHVTRLTLKLSGDEKARHLVVQTVPPGADLALRISADGRSVERYSLEMKDVAVTVAEAERLLREAKAPLRVWYLAPGSGRHRVELDEDTLSVLRALGSVQ